MRILLNGEPTQTAARTLEELVAALGYGELRIATALNGSFVPVRARPETRIAEDDKVEIVAPRQGG